MNRQLVTVGGAVVVLLIVGVIYLGFRTSDPPETVTPPITGAERAEQARGVIAEIEQARTRAAAEQAPASVAEQASPPAAEQPSEVAVAAAPQPGGATDLDAAFDQAQAFQRTGQLADAQVLYFFAARGGHARAAFELGAMNDPNHHSPTTSLLPEPDAFQAFRWYSAARDQDMPAAAERLEALREWAVAAAEAGDFEAEQLLLQWE